MDIAGARQTGEIRKLTSLLESSQALSTGLNFKVSLHRVLEILEKSHDAVRSAVAIAASEDRSHLQVVASVASGRDRMPDGAVPGGALVRRVVESARPIVVPRISREPALAERRADGDERSFVCVPLIVNRRAVGALCIELRFKSDRNYERTAKFFGVIASMIAQAVKVQRLLEADRERLVQENERLQGELRQRYDFSQILGTSGVDAPDLRADRPGRPREHDRPDSRRVGDRQGADRARHSLQLVARGEAVREGELRGAARHVDRVGALRLREGRVHRRHGAQEGPVRAGRRRHAVSRRDRRREPRRRR